MAFPIAAVLGLVGTVLGSLLSGKPKNEGIKLQEGSFGAQGGDMGGAKDFAVGGDRMNGPQELGKIASTSMSGGMFGPEKITDYMNIQPPQDMLPKYNDKIAGADAGQSAGFTPLTGPRRNVKPGV